MKRFKVRFNLGRGENYMKWKVQYPGGSVEYYSPSDVQIIMQECTLKNYKNVAKKIHEGSNKTVCAWVLCRILNIRKSNFIQADTIGEVVKYNPRVEPNWVLGGENADGLSIDKLVSVDFNLYKI
jgi:hypothetical protein